MQQQKKAAKFIGCLTYRVRFRWKVPPNGRPSFTPWLGCCALWPQWQRPFIALVFLGLSSSHVEAVLSLLSPSFLVCRISVRALVERDPGGRRFCPARRDLNPSRLLKYPMTVVSDTSADNPRAVLGQKRRYTQVAFEEDSWGKNSEAQSGNGLEVAGCHVRGKPFRTLPQIHWSVFTSAQRIHFNIFAAICCNIFAPSSFFHVHSSASE